MSKCGTTDLYRRLNMHPHIAPSHNKGPHFWDEKHTVDWYLNIYSTSVPAVQQCVRCCVAAPRSRAVSLTLPSRDPTHAIIGDASSNTLTYSGVGVRHVRQAPGGVSLPQVLAALQPALRMVAVLRNPVDRLYSAFYYYGHYAARFGANADGFHKYVQTQLDTFAGCTAARHECAIEGYGRVEQLVKGMYAMFLPDYFAAFPREQLLVLRSEAYSDDISIGLRAAMRHVGLDDPPPAVWERMVGGKRSNSRQGNGAGRGGDAGDMRPDTRAMLTAFYRSYNEELATLLDDNSYLLWHTEEPPARS